MLNYFEQMWQLASQGKLQGIWFWAAAYALLVCTYSLVFQWQISRWPETVGELQHLSVERFGSSSNEPSEQSYLSQALYRYRVNGKEYEGTRVSPWIFVVSHNARAVLRHQLKAVSYIGENQVTVFYHPGKPEKSYLIKPGIKGMLATFLCAILPFIGYLERFYF